MRASLAALLVIACVTPEGDLITAGANVPLRSDGMPEPERCPEHTLELMEAAELRPGDSTADVELDANQAGYEQVTLTAGPIESIMMLPMGRLGGATRLYGRVWISGRRVVIRYYHAQRAGGNVLPICAVARLGGSELEGKPGKLPNSIELGYSRAAAFVVQDFL